MIEATLVYGFLIALSMGLGALAFFVWAVLAGQMDETEDIKYRVLEGEEDGEVPGVGPRGGFSPARGPGEWRAERRGGEKP